MTSACGINGRFHPIQQSALIEKPVGETSPMKKQKLLPPLDYLLAFEAAATCGSFAVAARQMNVSETAISRKIRLLELHYDVPLFIRGHRSVSLTPQGQSLLVPVKDALGDLRQASKDMFSRQQKNAVVLAATNSVASLWLMPRLRKFNRTNSRIKIMLVASDDDKECLADSVDLSILRGEGKWSGYTSRRLFGETVFPVCAPKYLRNHPEASELDRISELDLIEVSNLHTEWMNWESWMLQQGVLEVAITNAASFNTYPLAIQAAVDGLGIALGWGHLVDGLLEKGELVRPLGDASARTESGYYLLKKENRKSFAERDIVVDWLLKESAIRHRYGTRNS